MQLHADTPSVDRSHFPLPSSRDRQTPRSRKQGSTFDSSAPVDHHRLGFDPSNASSAVPLPSRRFRGQPIRQPVLSSIRPGIISRHAHLSADTAELPEPTSPTRTHQVKKDPNRKTHQHQLRPPLPDTHVDHFQIQHNRVRRLIFDRLSNLSVMMTMV